MGDLYYSPSPEQIESSFLTRFHRYCEQQTGLSWSGSTAFHRFSVESFRDFWSLFLTWSGLHIDGEASPICDSESCEHATFFPNVTLNYTQNLLNLSTKVQPDSPAVIAVNERGERIELSWQELREQTIRVACGLRELGLKEGDHVIAVACNTLDTIIASLAAIGLGAVWSSVAPDLGVEAVLSRFSQLQPKVLFCHSQYTYQGRTHQLQEYLELLVKELPSLQRMVSLGPTSYVQFNRLPITTLETLVTTERPTDFSWPMLPFNHPLFALFSSGTTGTPKAIIHGTGGTLLEHFKEHRLHSNFGFTDRLLFHTSCGWMMWNWQLSALACGTTLVVYDGSPTYPKPDAMWELLQKEQVTVFGTSPTYIQYCRDAGVSPKDLVPLDHLRTIQSTGSVLSDSHFDWIKEHLKSLPVQSISGGTDIVGCFVLGHPNLPVFRGESQSISLGMDVRAYDEETQREVPFGEMGELICANPFPSRPIGFLQDPLKQRFHNAYFAQNEKVWTHGDYLIVYPHGSARILGRSDGVLNIRGIRIGPAEIYQVLEEFHFIKQAMAVEQKDTQSPGGTRMVLLIVLQEEHILEKPKVWAIKKRIKQSLTSVHVPSIIIPVSALPTTFSGKLSTRATRDAVNHSKIVNAGALKNSECLAEIQQHPELQPKD